MLSFFFGGVSMHNYIELIHFVVPKTSPKICSDHPRVCQDQMYVLLLICNALCPQPLDESLEKPIREKHSGILGMIWNRDENKHDV